MTNYERKRCVVCNRVGGIAKQSDDTFVCAHCGTPYRQRSKAVTTTPPPATVTSASVDHPHGDLVWFEFTHNGKQLTGFYDCPVLPSDEEPTENRNRLLFMKYLVEKGHLTGDTHPVVPHHPEQ